MVVKMNIDSIVSKLDYKNGIYFYKTKDSDNVWELFQEREKSFWKNKITGTNYNPNPVSDFTPFLKHWGVSANVFANKKVLEIGSGPFGIFAAVAMINQTWLPKELVIIDPLMSFYQQFKISEMMPQHAHRIEGIGESIPFPDNFFDIIVTTNTIDHVKDYNIFLSEIKRLLNPEGSLYFSVHTLNRLAVPLKSLIKEIDKNHPHHFSDKDIRKIFLHKNFHIENSLNVPMFRENPIPPKVGLFEKIKYYIGFRLMGCLYGVAKINK